MIDGPFSVSSWEQFLPPNAVIMARRVATTAEGSLEPAVDSAHILFEAPGLDLPGHRELFEKIMGALNLTSAEYRIVSGSTENAAIRFVADEADALTPGVTYSLSTMLKNPALKKAVWAHLKEALVK